MLLIRHIRCCKVEFIVESHVRPSVSSEIRMACVSKKVWVRLLFDGTVHSGSMKDVFEHKVSV